MRWGQEGKSSQKKRQKKKEKKKEEKKKHSPRTIYPEMW